MTAALIVVACVAWCAVGLCVARWSWQWLGIWPSTVRGHLALGATSHVWPLLLAVVGAVWWMNRWVARRIGGEP